MPQASWQIVERLVLGVLPRTNFQSQKLYITLWWLSEKGIQKTTDNVQDFVVVVVVVAVCVAVADEYVGCSLGWGFLCVACCFLSNTRVDEELLKWQQLNTITTATTTCEAAASMQPSVTHVPTTIKSDAYVCFQNPPFVPLSMQ